VPGAGGLTAADLDAVGYSYSPNLVDHDREGVDAGWERLRTTFVERAPYFLRTALPGLDPDKVTFVRHHLAHAASAALAAPFDDCAVMTADGRGEAESSLLGEYRDGKFTEVGHQPLPDSLGLTYESLTEHLGFHRSSDEYKVMALASYGKPRFLEQLREHIRPDGLGGFRARPPGVGAVRSPRTGAARSSCRSRPTSPPACSERSRTPCWRSPSSCTPRPVSAISPSPAAPR